MQRCMADESQTRATRLSALVRDMAKAYLAGFPYALADEIRGALVDVARPPHEAGGCAICHDDDDGGTFVRLPRCRHAFHEACVMAWLLGQPDRVTCPLCRAPVVRPGSTWHEYDTLARLNAALFEADDAAADVAPHRSEHSRTTPVGLEALPPPRDTDAAPPAP